MSKEGPDIDKSLEMISKNKDKIQLIPKADFKELQYYYNLSDVVIDQFNVGSFGMIAIESMMCKKPIITEIKAELFKENNVEIPQGIINTSNEETIVKEIIHLAEDDEYKNELGEKNYQYMISKRNTDEMTNQYISICKKILGII